MAPPNNHILVTRHDRVPVRKVIDLESPSRPDERVFPLQFLRRDLARCQTARVLCALVVLTIPFALTLMTITQARPLVVDLAANPTPHGYTWSLSLFIVPVMVLAVWVSMRKQIPIKKRAFWITAALTAGCGILLDICFGLSFFTFLNRQHGSCL